ncbi:hypothetical protein Tco_0407224 [Tanacetum coccineum]
MANLFEDIQSAGSDTRPPMLDRSDFESWKQHIHLYCLGKENRENILHSIDEGPFKMGKFRETLAEGALHLGPEQDRVVTHLTPEEKERYKADIHAMNILLQGLPKDIYTLINHYTDAKDIWDNVKMLLEGSELTKDERESQLYDDFEHFRQCESSDNVNILQSIDEGPFKMGKFRETLVEGAEGALHLGPEWDRVVADLTPEEKERYKAEIRAMNILL